MKKTILITGASRGLGFFLAKKYLEDGNMVFAGVREVSSSNITALKEVYPDSFIPVELEVTDTASLNRAAERIGAFTDKLDVIINNAGIHGSTSFEKLENTDVDECLRVYDVNSLGPLRVVKAFLQYIRKGTFAKVINISSESGSIGASLRDREFDYCMSKAALNMETKLLSNYLKKDNVAVLSVHPGWMRTDMGGSNAELDPYDTACRLVELFQNIRQTGQALFIDNEGKEFPW